MQKQLTNSASAFPNTNKASLQLVLILVEGCWVGLETLPLPDIQRNNIGLVAV